jgi:hypothetical protein
LLGVRRPDAAHGRRHHEAHRRLFRLRVHGHRHDLQRRSAADPVPKSLNLLAYGPAAFNNLTATVTDYGALRLTSKSLLAGTGIKWQLGTLPAGTYRFDAFGTFTRTNVYLAVTGPNNQQLGLIDCDHPSSAFTLSEPTACTLKALGKIESSGCTMDEVYMPMLTRVDSGALVWQPPENLKATGGGSKV